MPDIEALEVALDEDLRALSVYLWRRGLPHRITERAGRQILWVADPGQAEEVRDLYQRLRRGEQLPPVQTAVRHSAPRLALPLPMAGGFAPWRIPVTAVCILLSFAGFFIAAADDTLHWLHWLTFFDFETIGANVVYTGMGHQYWRLITPIFLHFGLQHIAFNMVLFWFFAKQVEIVQGSARLLGLVLLIGLGSNIVQVMATGHSIFGGMSGVVFGLFGYCAMWGWLRPGSALQAQKPLVIMMLLSLLLDVVGYTKLLGIGAVANAAHLGGLGLGLLLGLGAVVIERRPE